MKQHTSLFQRTALTVAAGLLIFQLSAVTAIFTYLVLPLAHRSADDLADFLLLSARVWYELPAQQRPSFVTQLKEKHRLILLQPVTALPDQQKFYPYIYFLRAALTARLGEEQDLRLAEKAHEYFQVEFLHNGIRLRFEFSKNRIPPRPSSAFLWIMFAGFIATLGLSWLLAGRVTAPVYRLANAARAIGRGEPLPLLPETGAAEFATLAKVFNETSQQLEARRTNQTTLLVGISHDLRTPLARMKMALGMLIEGSASPLLTRMERDIAEMDTLIGAQLELARAQEPEAVQLTNIDTLLAGLVNAASEVSENVYLTIRGDACIVEVAPMALRRCISNLLHNALRYDDKSIQVIRRRLRGKVFIGVRDQGPGIPPELAAAIFRPFYRIDSSRNRSTGGSGLGLAIARQLAETHAWKVVYKPRRGGGASFWLLLN